MLLATAVTVALISLLQCSQPWKVKVKSLSCVQLLSNVMDCSPPGSFVLGISQARILEWVAICFSRGSSLPRDQTRA